MTGVFRELSWLPPAPAEFNARCAAIEAATEPLGRDIQSLASHRIDRTGTARLAETLRQVKGQGRDLAPLATFKLGYAAAFTTDFLTDHIEVAAARHGVAVDLICAPYDQIAQQALDPQSALSAARPDAVLLGIDHRWFQIGHGLDGPGIDYEQRLEAIVAGFASHAAAPVIIPTVPLPPGRVLGSFERQVSESLRERIARVNELIIAVARRNLGYVLDVADAAERLGADSWFDDEQWHRLRLPFSAPCSAIYGELIGRLLGAIRGRSRKCLVLDLDNTLWGGVIGDDGVNGIQLGEGDPVGEAFLAVQRAVLAIKDRGIILAVSSKNDEEIARQGFKHPAMLLKESDIAVFQANWTDKPMNLVAIAKSLNIGEDALVLLDDNPAERAQVRAAMPHVAVPELPENPHEFASRLLAAGYFEAVSFSEEDRRRANFYAETLRRADVAPSTQELPEYLAELGMRLTIRPFDAAGRQRTAQLINKSNQFNLTGRRYTVHQVQQVESAAGTYTCQAHLSDRYGDFGVISVAIARVAEGNDKCAEIDTWLMSCRALGRRVEDAILADLARWAKRLGIVRLIGAYIPSGRNAMVAEHFSRLGFELTEESESGVRRYALDLERYCQPTLPYEEITFTGL